MGDGKMSLDEVLDRKWKKLSSYMHEEQLFKAYSYLMLLEHQVDHRLTVLTTTLAASPPPPTDGNSSSVSAAGPSAEAQALPAHSSDKTFSSSSSSSANPSKVGDSTKESAGGGAASQAAGVTTMSKRRYEEMKRQRELLLDFQRKLLTTQELENLRFVMIWAYQMLVQFHLEHLKQACEDPRLSFCESLSSLARSGSCASSQLSAFSSANLGANACASGAKAHQGLGGVGTGAGGVASSSSNHRSANATPELGGGGEGDRTERDDPECLLTPGGGRTTGRRRWCK